MADQVSVQQLPERAHRILDVASELLLRVGYKRLTINDVAERARIGTGTVYLHWRTKEALFESVLLRELLTVWRTLIAHLHEHPADATLARLICAQTSIIRARPLADALFHQDAELLGKLAHNAIVRQSQPFTTARELMALLRSLHLVRTDVDLSVQAYAFSAAVTGLALIEQFISPDERPSPAEHAEAVSQVMRAFEPTTLPVLETIEAQIAPALIRLYEQACAHYEQQLQARLITPDGVSS